MKKNLFSALALVALMTACSTDTITPYPVTGAALPTPAYSLLADSTNLGDDSRDQPAGSVHKPGQSAKITQPIRSAGSTIDRPAGDEPSYGKPVSAVVPADTLRKIY